MIEIISLFSFFDKRLLPDFSRNIFQLSGIYEFPFQSFSTFSKQIERFFWTAVVNIFEPHQRFELWTPSLEDQYSNHWANEATCFGLEIHNINLLTIIKCLMLTSISLKNSSKNWLLFTLHIANIARIHFTSKHVITQFTKIYIYQHLSS